MNSTEREFSDNLSLLTDFSIQRLLVAFSGGCDSLALLSMSVSVLGKDNVIACYVNHRLRSDKELENEIKLNEKNCKDLGVKLIIKDLGIGEVERVNLVRKGGIEDAARYLRYIELKKTAAEFGCSFIATAHHEDDQIETVLMRIINGSPVMSLRGISEKTDNIIRPLLSFSRHELEEYISEKGLKYSTDSTNEDSAYRRNEIRNVIIPELALIMPDFRKRILEIRNRAVSMCYGFCFTPSWFIDYDSFLQMKKEHKEMVLYAMWDYVMKTQLPQTLINRVFLATEGSVISSNGGSFSIYNGILFLTDNNESSFENYSGVLESAVLPGNLELVVSEKGNPDTDVFLPESIIPQLKIRFVREADRITLKDGSKTVKRLLQDMKIPPLLRSRVPVIVLDDEIIAVLGFAYGGRNRVCRRMLTSLAHGQYYQYICIKKVI